MSINLVSLALQYLSPDMIAKIASALGLDKGLVGKAATAAIPGLLASLANTASTPDGARKIANAVSQQSPNILDTLASTIGGAGQQSLINNGLSTLSSLLGGSAAPALAGAVGKFAGIGQGPSSSMIGMLAPAVLGVLGKQQAAQGLDASGLAKLLASQKSNITAAMPTGFSRLLDDTGLPAFTEGSQAARTAQSKISEVTRAPASSAFPGWLMWLLPLLALGAVAWWLGHRGAQVAEEAKTTAGQAVQNLTVGGEDLGSTVQAILGNLKTTLHDVKDKASAEAALAKLQGAASELERVGRLSGQLPAAGKTALDALVATARPSIDELSNQVLALPGVSTISKPAIDALKAKLDAFGKTAEAVQNLSVEGVDLGSTLQATLGSLKTTLQGVKDTGTAEAAMSKLQGAASELDKVGGLSGKLPAASKTTLAALVTAARPSIEELFNQVLAVPGVSAIAKPAIDTLRAKLDTLSKT